MAKLCNLAMRESSQSRNIERMGWVQTNHTRSVMMRSAKLTRNEQSIERREVLHDAASRLVSSVVVGSGCSRAAPEGGKVGQPPTLSLAPLHPFIPIDKSHETLLAPTLDLHDIDVRH
jgi:hypothetical protein